MNVKSEPPNLDIWSQLNILGCESVVLFVLTRCIFLLAVQEFTQRQPKHLLIGRVEGQEWQAKREAKGGYEVGGLNKLYISLNSKTSEFD